ncbi:formate-dependent nitrite reductase membrane component NrfD [Nocardioides daedukensis]|uniref:Formate-dependent nitrite reductase membrane component NrfD n=1 Tax=Nocardioides daedukensis TaxID=634462 RepID=A0A7Y9UNJ4_9ACTN|nr:NrfD/PsrC family molybdoenzyme membrane anchor subunit [Nocardioides daedukensis]NYG57222.1 formate-dependent nitrite reductase membrane component NrfD [Nocardioides daedukensis]
MTGPEQRTDTDRATDAPQQSGARHRGSPARDSIVPEADFESYYGRPIVKPAPWEHDIAYYMFTGGVAAGSAILGAGADLTERPGLRRTSRLGSAVALVLSMFFLIKDLGKPSRFLNMLRVAKPTSPMSVGTWLLSLHGPFSALASAAEVAGLLPSRWQRGPIGLALRLGRPAGIAAAVTAPPVAAYTAVLLSDTATPAWHSAHEELPFVFCGSAAAASGGLGLIGAPLGESGPARAFAIGGAVVDLVAEHRMEQSMGISAETLHQGSAGRWMQASKGLMVLGATGALLGRRSRAVSIASGAALMAGSLCTRIGVFEAGIASANDPKYVVVPQRERVARGEAVRHSG